ncbi:MAG: mannose-1-phosphate guanylyltransferase, partial [Candidatus Dadabacteria bacterium]
MTYIVIMAGGQGTRFWPLSRKNFPKQFLSIDNSGSLLQRTA